MAFPPSTDARSTPGESTRRRFTAAVALAGVVALAGCDSPSRPSDGGSDVQASTTSGGENATSRTRRDEILEMYAMGRAARRDGSRRWIEGRDAWELNRFDKASTAWQAASDRFATGERKFAAAARDCQSIGATRAERICADARDYCGSMSKSAAAYATAAADYREGAFDAGEANRDTGFDHYETALDYEVRDPDKLKTALWAAANE